MQFPVFQLCNKHGYRRRLFPIPIRLVRLKCSNPACRSHYTAYPSDILPRHRYSPETVSTLTDECLNSSSGLEQAFCDYQHTRENCIEDGKEAGPDVSSLRRWIKNLFNPQSMLSLFLSAYRQSLVADRSLIMVVSLTVSLTTQLLVMPLAIQDVSSPIVPVTDSSNQANGCVVTQNDLNFHMQEHPP